MESSSEVRILSDNWYGDAIRHEFTPLSSILSHSSGPRLARWANKSGAVGRLARTVALFRLARFYDGLAVNFSRPGNKLLAILLALTGQRKLIVFELLYHQGGKSLPYRVFYAIYRCLILRPALQRATLAAQVLTHWEVDYYAASLGIAADRLRCIKWPLRGLVSSAPARSTESRKPLVLSSGRAACDWSTLFKAAEGQDWPLTVVCGRKDYPEVLRLNKADMATVMSEISVDAHEHLMRKATLYCLCLKEEVASSGQIRLSHAIELRLPVVATNVRGLDGYLVDNMTAKVVPVGDPLALRAAVNKLLGDQSARDELAEAAFACSEGSTRDAYLAALRAWAVKAAYDARASTRGR